MKKLIGLILLISSIGYAAPDCYVTYRFSNRTDGYTLFSQAKLGAPDNSPAYDNRLQGCTAWQMSYDNEGLSGLTVTLQDAPSSFSTPNYVPGTWETFSGTAMAGTNANTATTSGFYSGTGYFPFLRVILSGTTGTGSVNVVLQGWKNQAYLANSRSSGTFTPAVLFGGAAVGVTYSTQIGDYIKIGNLVIARAYVVLTAKGSSTGAVTITGLPFTANNTTGIRFGGVSAFSLINGTAIAGMPEYYLTNGTAVVNLAQTNVGVEANLTDVNFTNTTGFQFTIIYFT